MLVPLHQAEKRYSHNKKYAKLQTQQILWQQGSRLFLQTFSNSLTHTPSLFPRHSLRWLGDWWTCSEQTRHYRCCRQFCDYWILNYFIILTDNDAALIINIYALTTRCSGLNSISSFELQSSLKSYTIWQWFQNSWWTIARSTAKCDRLKCKHIRKC